jgi:hypothetical protein
MYCFVWYSTAYNHLPLSVVFVGKLPFICFVLVLMLGFSLCLQLLEMAPPAGTPGSGKGKGKGKGKGNGKGKGKAKEAPAKKGRGRRSVTLPLLVEDALVEWVKANECLWNKVCTLFKNANPPHFKNDKNCVKTKYALFPVCFSEDRNVRFKHAPCCHLCDFVIPPLFYLVYGTKLKISLHLGYNANLSMSICIYLFSFHLLLQFNLIFPTCVFRLQIRASHIITRMLRRRYGVTRRKSCSSPDTTVSRMARL